MRASCPYCSQLTEAVHNSNFCSRLGGNMQQVKSNAFYFKTKHLYSGEHVSRLSIRMISNGYQYHSIGNREVMLDSSKYLITNQGDLYKSELDTHLDIEGMVVAFSSEQIDKLAYYLQASDDKILDNPFDKSELLPFEYTTLDKNPEIELVFTHLKGFMVDPERKMEIDYDEKFHDLLLLMLKGKKILGAKIDLMKVKKKSTKMEIFKRLARGKEFMDAHLDQNIHLSDLSRVSMMSSFHFLRAFKSFYQRTPHQYLTSKRLQKAKFLLKNTNWPIEQIAGEIGFEHVRSFRRSFKRYFQISPGAYRILA